MTDTSDPENRATLEAYILLRAYAERVFRVLEEEAKHPAPKGSSPNIKDVQDTITRMNELKDSL